MAGYTFWTIWVKITLVMMNFLDNLSQSLNNNRPHKSLTHCAKM